MPRRWFFLLVILGMPGASAQNTTPNELPAGGEPSDVEESVGETDGSPLAAAALVGIVALVAVLGYVGSQRRRDPPSP